MSLTLPDDLPIQLESLRQGLSSVAEWQTRCEAVGLTVRVDAAGHVFARWCPPSANAALAAVGTRAIRAEEPWPVLGGLEAIRVLQRVGYEPKRPIEVGLLAATANDGPPPASDAYHAWVGWQSEPGGKLEKQNAPVGIAMGITGCARYAFHVTGEGGDAAAVPMPERRDALCAAAETIHAIEQFARSSTSTDLVATVGQLDLAPGTLGSIPAEARFVLELHDTDANNARQVAEAIHFECNTIALRRGLKITSEQRHISVPLACDKTVIDAIEQSCNDADLRWWKMISRSPQHAAPAGHNSPAGLILIPGQADAHLVAGLEILTRTLAALSQT